MTPDQKAAIHRVIDQAISLGARVSVNIHTSYAEDDEPLINMLNHVAPDGEEVRVKTIQPTDSPTGRRYRVAEAQPDSLTDVFVFTKETEYRPNSRRFDVV